MDHNWRALPICSEHNAGIFYTAHTGQNLDKEHIPLEPNYSPRDPVFKYP